MLYIIQIYITFIIKGRENYKFQCHNNYSEKCEKLHNLNFSLFLEILIKFISHLVTFF